MSLGKPPKRAVRSRAPLASTRSTSILILLLTALLACVLSSELVGVSQATFSDAAAGGVSVGADQLDQPGSLLATANLLSVELTWTATPDSYASGYRVYRGTSSGGPYTLIETVTPRTTTAYTDPSLDVGTYYYVVRAFWSNWESESSNEVSCVSLVLDLNC